MVSYAAGYRKSPISECMARRMNRCSFVGVRIGSTGSRSRDARLTRIAMTSSVKWRGSLRVLAREPLFGGLAGQEVWVRQHGGEVEVRYGAECIAWHAQSATRHQVVTQSEHHQGIPLGSPRTGKTLIHMQQSAPVVEQRPLEAYESLAMGGNAMSTLERLRTTLTALNLTAIDARLEPLLESASKNESAYADFLLEVMSTEADARRQRSLKTRLQLAHLPYMKTFDQFDFAFQPSIDERQVRELRTLRFVQQASNVILLGPPGVGKTHLAVALAETAIQSGQAAYFMTAHDR